MKKLTERQREIAVAIGLRHRTQSRQTQRIRKRRRTEKIHQPWRQTNNWILEAKKAGLKFNLIKVTRVVLQLPERMNFSSDYEDTILYIQAIRRLVGDSAKFRKAYKLASVNFDAVKEISTPVAIVLTAELSRWDDNVRSSLKSDIRKWDRGIVVQLYELGFFDLFSPNQDVLEAVSIERQAKVNFVRYIKGRCGDNEKHRELKEKLLKLVDKPSIDKWTFLASGLHEAITNVTHHAYPAVCDFNERDKNWYLGGSFDRQTNEIRVVFYDQGIGIPRSLPSSGFWEHMLDFVSSIPFADRKKHEVLLKAAVELDRTSTNKPDRGKGLPDLLEIVKQRNDGYLAIVSGKGLYKFSISNGKEETKTFAFTRALQGTLIIWSITLAD